MAGLDYYLLLTPSLSSLCSMLLASGLHCFLLDTCCSGDMSLSNLYWWETNTHSSLVCKQVKTLGLCHNILIWTNLECIVAVIFTTQHAPMQAGHYLHSFVISVIVPSSLPPPLIPSPLLPSLSSSLHLPPFHFCPPHTKTLRQINER